MDWTDIPKFGSALKMITILPGSEPHKPETLRCIDILPNETDVRL